MGKFKAIRTLEEDIFNVVVKMMEYYTIRDKETYKNHLAFLEELNEEYKSRTGKVRLPPEEIIKYHERLWAF